MATKYTSKLRGKRILILGGTSGIGFGVAEACIEFGATVVVSSSTDAKIAKTIDRIENAYPDAKGRILGFACDLASPTAEANITKLLDFATNNGVDKLDHMVNTAGDVYSLPKISEVTAEMVVRRGTVRFVGSTMLAKHAPNYLNISADSSLTFTSGVNTHKPGPGWSLVAGYGSAIEGLTRGFAVDLKPIRVNCVAPGAIHTELFRSIGGDREQQMVNMYTTKTTVGRIGRVEDVVESYLASLKDGFMTGNVIHSNGGMLLL